MKPCEGGKILTARPVVDRPIEEVFLAIWLYDGKDERFSQTTLNQIESWIDKTTTAVSGAAVLFQASRHEVASYADEKSFYICLEQE